MSAGVRDNLGRKVNAGAVVTRNNDTEVLLDYRTRQDDYSFPKGGVDPGEKLEAAAKREVLEETGCVIELLHEMGEDEFTHKKHGRTVNHLFRARLVEQKEKIEKNDNPVWVGFAKAKELLTYPDQVKYIEALEHENE